MSEFLDVVSHPTAGKTMFQLPKLDCKILHATPYEAGETTTKKPHIPGTGGKPIEGITPETTGCREITFSLFELAPGAEDGPVHIHEHETSGYVVNGALALMHGDGLEKYEIAEAGSFVFVPPGVPHFIENASQTEPCAVLLTRYVTETDTTAVILPDMEKMRLARKQRSVATPVAA
ncbi:cupin domain-containing protein [Pseudoduganella chitinolytica]|uniref:Cupin domain-containing protein n=1 Tax=Pseudoduganella chitinolytica TaxID=34070 RepID=A0ABY8BB05_9BURK|nr:cupin domain-containing protein [Pseudoduganella chitinolytica]WEF31549.1 cupin domain-containing protein [Pseudoduganella chitinolytica]